MRTAPATRHRLTQRRWLQPRSLAFRLAGCSLSVCLAAILAGTVAQTDLVWIANGVLLTYLLLAPRRLWRAYLVAGLLGHIAGSSVIHTPWQHSLVDTPVDILEALVAAQLLRRRSAQLPNFTQIKYVLRFISLAGLAAPLIAGFVAALVLALWQHIAFFKYFVEWVIADGLGACVVTPACVAIFRTRIFCSLPSRRVWAHLVPLAAAGFAVLCQSKIPLTFVLYPLLILILLRLGRGWAAAATLFAGAMGIWYTVHGKGPFAAAASLSRLEPAIVLQLFIVSAIFMLYSISEVIENLLTTKQQLQEIAAEHKIVTENSRDIVIVAGFEGQRSLVSASGAHWSGWTQEELRHFDNLALVHPADCAKMSEIVAELRAGKDEALAECRLKKHDGSYVWVEAGFRVIRDPGTGLPTGILNNVREITQRKLAEQQLAEAYRAVEELAITDALTGLANRRRFDQYLTAEWRRGMRERSPLSLVLIDADLFKSYNDTYGHLRGDNCLKQIAEAIQDIVSRPGDLVARFGGEEFAVVLPNTPAPGALLVAQDVCDSMRSRQLPHSGNAAGVVTISAGCATLVPGLGQHSPSLIDCADQALYDAKRNGRNCAREHRSAAAENRANDMGQDAMELKSA